MTLGEFRERTKGMSDDLELEFYSERCNDSTQPVRLDFNTEGYIEFIIDDIKRLKEARFSIQPYQYINEVLDMAIKALEQEPCEDCISRAWIKEAFHNFCYGLKHPITEEDIQIYLDYAPSIQPTGPTGNWIPVSELLPHDLEPVNITWVNHNPESYYVDIKDKPFMATGVYFNGKWYWWSTLCTDILAEYGHNYNDIIDDDIEIIAWMRLPEPYKPHESEE